MEIFYSDKIKKFECNIDIDGASINETKARLALSFDKSKTKYLYEGTISSDGKCTIKIPEIKNAPNLVGKVSLEVIAEGTYFEPWNDNFIIKQHKNVSVKRISEEVEDDIDETVKIRVDFKNDNRVNLSETNKESMLPNRLGEIINEDEYIDYMKNVRNNKVLLEEYSNFEPNLLTTSLGEMYGITNESAKDKTLLFYIEKKVIK